MLDIKFIRQNPEIVKESLAKRNYRFDLDSFLLSDKEYRESIVQIEQIRSDQNKISKEIQNLIKEKKDATAKIQASKELKSRLDSFCGFENLEENIRNSLLRIPNIPHPSVPVGDASKNIIGQPIIAPFKFDFVPKDHIQLAESLDIIDFKRSAKLSGANFVLLKGLGARLQRGLINFMIDLHTGKHGYKEVYPPVLVLPSVMEGTGQLPNLEEDMYKLKDDDLFLIPTAEVPVTNIHRQELLDEKDLPIKYVAYTSCFRREAGSYGADTRGLMRVHQFDKVELVKFTRPDQSYPELESLLKDACKVIELLNLPYRIVTLATADISFASAKTYDIEIYAPGIDKWLEVSSCSNFEDFQARRANIRFKDKKNAKNLFLHTLNGSGLALPRLVISILENYQQARGSIRIPEALKPYMNGLTEII
ncbi:MAG: serine--tRNA ligase [Candidatus Omnitrophica bacterium]|nr:serine--tRNA ligase [Candidatus Omnitrophota bacterium]